MSARNLNVATINFNMELFCGEYFQLIYYPFGKTNYAIYCSYYVNALKIFETLCLGLKEMLKNKSN